MNEDVNIMKPMEGERERTLAENVAREMQKYRDIGIKDKASWMMRFYDVLAGEMAGRYMSKGIDSIDEKEIMLLQAIGYSLVANRIDTDGLKNLAAELNDISVVLSKKLNN